MPNAKTPLYLNRRWKQFWSKTQSHPEAAETDLHFHQRITPCSRGGRESVKTLQQEPPALKSSGVFLVNTDLVFPGYEQQPHYIIMNQDVSKSASDINFKSTPSPQVEDNRAG